VFPTFEVRRPGTLAEALEILANNENVLPIAGGTNLIVDARSGKLNPEVVVEIGHLDELRGVEIQEGEIRIGATTTIAELLESDVIAKHAEVLRQACRSFANALIRNRATIGGNLVNAAPCADTAPALLVLDAEVELASVEETRRVPLDEFLVDAFQTLRRPNELLTAVRFPVPADETVGRFEKMGLRKISCMAKVDVAVQVAFGEGKTVERARIAIGAASSVAVRARDVEGALAGQVLDEKLALLAADMASEVVIPRVGSEYKRQVVHGLTRRLLEQVGRLDERSVA